MKHIHTIIALLVLVITTNCGLIFEKSIKDSEISVTSPADSTTITNYSQQFRWERIDHATRYRLQIYQNDFVSGILVYDTIVTDIQVTLTFQPGKYAWRVRGENSGSETDYHNGFLYVKKGNFDEQKILIKEPKTGFVSTASSIKFSWEPLYDATFYIIEIDTISEDFSNPVISDTLSASLTQILKVIPKRGDYWWRIKAIDATNEKSLYNSPQTFSYTMKDIDLSVPQNEANVSTSSSFFEWTPIENVNSYKLNIYNSDSVTLFRSRTSNSNSISLSDLNMDVGKKYFWSVSAIDNNGFIGSSSKRTKFVVTP